MTPRPSIFQLLTEIPGPIGSGGRIRSYHFVRALAAAADLSVGLLIEQGQDTVPQDLANQCHVVLQPPAGFRQRVPPATGLLGGGRRALSVLATPWSQGGKRLMIAGAGNCVLRSENRTMQRRGALHALYAALLHAEVSLCRHLFPVFPTEALLHIEEFEAILPEIVQHGKEREPEVVWCEHSYLYPLAARVQRLFPKARLVCNAHNVESKLQERNAQLMKSPRAQQWLRMESAILKAWEKKMLSAADLVFCCSEADARLLHEVAPRGKARIEVVPNGVDTEHFQPGSRASTDPTLLFSGSAGYGPNDDAVAWLAKDILPLIRRAVSGCRLCLAGSKAAIHWGRFADGDPMIEVASDAPDMRPWFAKASVCLVPLRSGGGTRLKVLEAMSMGRAVVSTSIGAEGIEALPDLHLLIADTPESFARAVIELLQNEHKREAIARAARALVCNRYDWNILMPRAMGLLAEVCWPQI